MTEIIEKLYCIAVISLVAVIIYALVRIIIERFQ